MTKKFAFIKRLLWAAVETIWFTIVLIALLIWVLPDFLPRRKRK